MFKGKLSKEFLELCRRVEKIDPEAAWYLRLQVRNIRTSHNSTSGILPCCFNFSDTPQGADYWRRISIELGD